MGRALNPFNWEGRRVPERAYIAGQGLAHFRTSYAEPIHGPWAKSAETWTSRSNISNLQTSRIASRNH